MTTSLPGKAHTITGILSALLLLFALSPALSAASSLTIAWDPNTEDDLAGYMIYYGTRSGDYDFAKDSGDVARYTIRGLEPETRYYLALTAYDFSGNESDFSAEVSAVTEAGGSPVLIPSGGDGGGCFIATAAYGSYLNPHVKILRDFRDELLTSSVLGRKCAQWYNRYSPPLADHLKKHRLLRVLTRQALIPLIWMSSLSLKTVTSLSALLLLLSFLISFLALCLHRHQAR